MHGSAAAQIKEAGAQAAADTGPDLLETWLILEYCDQGSFDHAIRSGKFTKDLVQPSKPSFVNTTQTHSAMPLSCLKAQSRGNIDGDVKGGCMWIWR